MAISSAGVAGLKPGVVDNAAARPASPFEGQMIYQKDTDQLLVWNGTAWTPPTNMPWGKVARAYSSTAFTLTTTEVVATGMDVSFTAVANRVYKITYVEPEVDMNSTAGAYFYMKLRLNNASGTTLQATVFQNGSAFAAGVGHTCVTYTDFNAGAVQIVGTMIRGGGGGDFSVYRSAAGGFFSHLVVEDVGPL